VPLLAAVLHCPFLRHAPNTSVFAVLFCQSLSLRHSHIMIPNLPFHGNKGWSWSSYYLSDHELSDHETLCLVEYFGTYLLYMPIYSQIWVSKFYLIFLPSQQGSVMVKIKWHHLVVPTPKFCVWSKARGDISYTSRVIANIIVFESKRLVSWQQGQSRINLNDTISLPDPYAPCLV